MSESKPNFNEGLKIRIEKNSISFETPDGKRYFMSFKKDAPFIEIDSNHPAVKDFVEGEEMKKKLKEEGEYEDAISKVLLKLWKSAKDKHTRELMKHYHLAYVEAKDGEVKDAVTNTLKWIRDDLVKIGKAAAQESRSESVIMKKE